MNEKILKEELRVFRPISGGSPEVFQVEKVLEPGTVISCSGILVFLHWQLENPAMQRVSWDPRSDSEEYFAIDEELKNAVLDNFVPGQPAA